ncbi:MAG TPA: pseudouridine synthase [Saprospiraceae bacterium]|nr:pseudouridine synthase [Saprospiraceae bacterium]
MQHRHFIIHKPPRYLSQFIYEGKRKGSKGLLGELYDFPKGTMAIGRLDEDSEGLLFLTTDGKVSELIRSRKYEKEYYAQVAGIIHQAAITQLQKGVQIGLKGGLKYQTKPCQARIIQEFGSLPIKARKMRSDAHGPTSWVSITLTEGKFRQVRKMTAAVGFPTLQLIRIRIGDVFLDLEQGRVKEVPHLTHEGK